MRCQTARRRISDELDGSLRPGRRPGLEAHLQCCPACRAYREDLARIQAAAQRADEPDAFWAGFEARLGARMAAAEAGRERVGPPFAARRRRAWAVAAVLVLAGVSLWYARPRPAPPPAETWIAWDDVLDPVVQAAETSPDLAGRIDREIQASYEALLPGGDAAALPVADPLFWESLSEEDLRAVVAALERESGVGGPQ
jgi:anti-sigma factor RsiW